MTFLMYNQFLNCRTGICRVTRICFPRSLQTTFVRPFRFSEREGVLYSFDVSYPRLHCRLLFTFLFRPTLVYFLYITLKLLENTRCRRLYTNHVKDLLNIFSQVDRSQLQFIIEFSFCPQLKLWQSQQLSFTQYKNPAGIFAAGFSAGGATQI